MLTWATIQAWDAGTYTCTLQLRGSLDVWLTSVPVSRSIASAEMTVGRAVILAIPEPENPTDVLVIGVKG